MSHRFAFSTAFSFALALGAATAALAQPIEELAGSDSGTRLGAIAVSADGRNAYALGSAIDELAAYPRNPGDGTLANPVLVSFFGGDDLALDADSAHLYVARGDEIAIFARAALDGALTPLPSENLSSGTGPCALAVSPDGAFLLAACSGSDALHSFSRDPGSGALASDGSVAASGDPADVAIAPDGTSVYVAAPAADAIHAFSRDATSGALTPLGDTTDGVGGASGLDAVAGVAVTPDAGAVVAIGRTGSLSSVVSLSRDSGTGLLSFVARADLPASRPAVRVAATDETIWVLSQRPDVIWGANGSRTLLSWMRDPLTDELTAQDRIALANLESFGAGGLALAADSGEVIASGNFFGVERARVAANTGVMELLQTLRDGEGGVTGITGARAIATTPDGRHVLVLADAPSPPGLASFARDAADGTLAFRATDATGLADPRALVASPGGDFVYVADATNGIVRFALAPETGALDPLDVTTQGLGASGARVLATSRDGAHLYAAGPAITGVAHYLRDAATGALTYVETTPISAGGDGVHGLALSADERFLNIHYVLADFRRIAVPRDLVSGALGAPGAPALEDLESIVFPRGGSHAYATVNDDCETHCIRDLEVYPLDPLTGLAGVRTQAIASPVMRSELETSVELLASPDGHWIHAIGAHHLAVFARDAATGLLSLADTESGATDAAAASPDAANLYLASAGGELRVYAPEPGAFAIGASAWLCVAAFARRRTREPRAG